MNTANHVSHSEHGFIDIPINDIVPSVKIDVSRDSSNAWLLEVRTKHFEFAPKKVGHQLTSYNEGHAHLYINGEKINRIYGTYYHIGPLKQGKNVITMTLNSNNHQTLAYNGKPIEHTKIVEVDA